VASITGNLDNPLILAIETSGRLGSVALAEGDKLLAESRFSGPMRHSAEIFPAITDLLGKFNKKPDQIEQVYISAGPGSFTGLRIAVTLAKTLALANQAKLARRPFGGIVAVDTLDCIAANVIDFAPPSPPPQLNTQHGAKRRACFRNSTLKTDDRLAVILDAKRGQFFIAVYEKTQGIRPQTPDAIWKKVLPDCLMTAEDFLTRFTNQPTTLTGEGLVFYKDKFAHKNIRVLDEKYWNPSAANVHRLSWYKAQNGEFSDPLTLTPNYIRGPDAIVKQI
jgi:tRNA threonylcarbamoyl adenosine modification protein YeaZ